MSHSIKLHRYNDFILDDQLSLVLDTHNRISDLYNFLINLNGFHEICENLFFIPKPFCMFQGHSEYKILTDSTHTTPA